MLLIALVTMLRFYAVSPWAGQEQAQFEVTASLGRSQLLPVLAVALGPLWQGLAIWFPDPVPRGFA
jgi:hypothetical protein